MRQREILILTDVTQICMSLVSPGLDRNNTDLEFATMTTITPKYGAYTEKMYCHPNKNKIAKSN
ncbi:UNVERIFIED_CONTAM: hypothetical protein NCL1_59791 [Trichonephila clavipes]